MKHMETETIPAKQHTFVAYTSCDICGGKIEPDGSYGVDEVEVKHKTGSAYPDGGWGKETTVDLCGKCFDDILLPWLKKQGVKPTIKDWDY